MALALYRTYRPGTLADVVGQAHVTEPLARALASGRTHHAYLFSGPRGCGKTSTARILARSLNCEQGPTPTPCGQCRSCVDLAPNGPGSIDVVELDAATHRGIDDARELREKAIYAPAASRYRVYIIDEAHQLTNEAANALLKLIEEPPAHLRFIFATTEPDKIIPTIRSRTFHYPFRLVPARTLADHLGMVCAAEGVPAEPAALAVVARTGAGSVRDSLSVLGQLLAGVGPEGLTHAEAVQALGLTDDSLIDGFVDALSGGSVAAMLRVVDGVISAGHDPRRFVSDVLDRLRDLIVLRADPQALESGLIDVPDEAGQRLVSQAETLGLAELSHAADLVSAGLSEVKGATAPRLQLELLCARLALHHPADDLASVLARLERLERTVAAGPPPAAAGGDAGGAVRPPAGASEPGLAASGPAGRVVGGDDRGSGASEMALGAAPAPLSTASSSGAATGALPGPSGSGPGAASPAPPRRPTLRSGRGSPTPPEAGAVGSAPLEGSDPPGQVSNSGQAGQYPEDGRSGSSTVGTVGAAGAAGGQGSGAGAVSSPTGPASDSGPTPSGPGAESRSAGAAGGSGGQDVSGPAGLNDSDRASGTVEPGGAAGRPSQLARVQATWPAVLDRVAQGSRVAWALFAESRPQTLSEGTLAVAVSDQGKVAAITQRGHDVRLREALLAVLQLDVTIDVIYDAGSGGPGSGPAAGSTGAARAPARPPAAPSSRGRSAGASPGSTTPSSLSPAPEVDDGSANPPGRAEGLPRSPAASSGSSARAASATGAARGRASAAATHGAGATTAEPGRRGANGVTADLGGRGAASDMTDEPDLPSDDDPDLEDLDGLELVTRELGARTISEIDHT